MRRIKSRMCTLSFEKITISSSDSDVFMIALSKSRIINPNLYMLTGTKSKRRIININDVKEKWCEKSLPETFTEDMFYRRYDATE